MTEETESKTLTEQALLYSVFRINEALKSLQDGAERSGWSGGAASAHRELSKALYMATGSLRSEALFSMKPQIKSYEKALLANKPLKELGDG